MIRSPLLNTGKTELHLCLLFYGNQTNDDNLDVEGINTLLKMTDFSSLSDPDVDPMSPVQAEHPSASWGRQRARPGPGCFLGC